MPGLVMKDLVFGRLIYMKQLTSEVQGKSKKKRALF